jgi:hypothetical protein
MVFVMLGVLQLAVITSVAVSLKAACHLSLEQNLAQRMSSITTSYKNQWIHPSA